MSAEGTKNQDCRSTCDSVPKIRLRSVEHGDLPKLFEYQCDPEANQMSFTRPRSAEDFDAHWEKIFCASDVIVQAIIVDDALAGSISCFKCDGLDSVGYWIGKDWWGKGVATRALELLLVEFPTRPLYSRVAVSNVASIRVLEKCGFAVQRHEWSPATDRYVECEEAILKLA